MLRDKNKDLQSYGNNAGEAVREDFASNLYTNMAEEIMIRLVLYNPVITDIDRVRLDFATRRVVLTGKQREAKEKEYWQLGFKPVQREGGNKDRADEFRIIQDSTAAGNENCRKRQHCD